LNGYLAVEVITYKSVTNQNQQRNAEENIAARKVYAEWFLANQGLNFVYVDEFGFNLSTQRHYGRARSGQRAIQITPANQGANVSVAMAIQRGRGIIQYTAKEKAFTAATFSDFIAELLASLQFSGETGVCIVMDNCKIHDRDDLPDRIEQADFTMKFLPPYSPMLNPIEEVIGDVKREIKTLLSVNFIADALRIQSLPWGQKTAARRELLLRALGEAIGKIGAATVDQHFDHSYRILPRCIQLEKV
jgi:transposase